MRAKLSRLIGVTALFWLLALPLGLTGCFGSQQQQQDADLEGERYDEEVDDQQGQDQQDQDQEGYEDQQGYDDQDEEGNEDEEGYEEALEQGNDDSEVLEGNQTQSDLEEIIAGQNADGQAQPVEEVADIQSAEPTTAAAGDAGAAPIQTPPALPEPGSKMPYIVRVGETLSGIAQMIYGDKSKWNEMAELTSISNPNFVRPGDVVYYQLSEQTLAFATAYEGTQKVAYQVQPGDTLARIAEQVYGQQGDWKVIWRQNGELDNPDRLEVGQSVHYLAPGALSAAIDYAKSLKVADLIKFNFGTEDPQQQDNTETEASVKVVKADQTNNNSNDTVSGFDMAKGMFNVFSANLGFTG